MLWAFFLMLLLLWLLGMASAYTVGGFIHFLLLVALVVWLLETVHSYVVARTWEGKHETRNARRHHFDRTRAGGARV